jgi:hypothetical protein
MTKFQAFGLTLLAILLILSISCGRAASDDSDSSAPRPVSAKMKVERDDARAGETGDLVLTINVASPAHIYAPNEPTNRSTPTSIKLELPKGVELAKDWSFPSSIKTKEGDLIYIGSNQARCTLRISAGVPARTLHIRAQMRYQACTDEACWLPESLPVSVTITLRSATR